MLIKVITMPYKINDMEKCNRFLDKLRVNSWRLWQTQYQWDKSEGYHACFWKTGEKDIELVTHNEEVQDVIVNLTP
jgi:hypothetical protein